MNKLQEKADNLKLGLYIHVPFCARSCDFCHFYQEAPQREELERYLCGMESAMRANPPVRPVDTAFWGGGTPGLLPVRDLERLCLAMIHANGGGIPREWTVEMAPATIKRDKIKMLRDHGISRISMGVQTFDASLLEQLGRLHTNTQVQKAIEILHDEGMQNFNLDLIFAIPGQTRGLWRADLEQAIAAGATHISTYCLTFEEDTALWLRLQKGTVHKHSPEDEAAFHEISASLLNSAGYEQYEVSNYARPGHACEHNLNTWRMQEWIGYGPSASSQLDMRRWTEPHSLEQWLEGVENNRPAFADSVDLTLQMLAQDYLIFGLRMNAGVDLSEWRRRFGEDPVPGWNDLQARLLEEGLGQLAGTHFFLNERGLLLADRIGMEVLMLDNGT